MRNRVVKLAILIFAISLPFSIMASRAQELQCDEVIKKILQDTGDRCKDLGRNKGCYGNNLVMATPKDGVSPDSFVFNKPSDVVNIADIASLRMAAYKEGGSEWGVSYLRVQANFPDTQPGQYVTMLLFGDTTLEDRSRQVADKTQTEQKPMQAVYFRSGTATLACKRAPTSGMIIQTPKGAAKAELTMNEVKLSVGSTVFIESPDDDLPPLGATNTPVPKATRNTKQNKLVVTTIEGEAKITANGVTRTVKTGQKSEVPLISDNSRPAGAPSVPVNASVDVKSIVDVVIDEELIPPTPSNTPSYTPGGPTLTFTPSATFRVVTLTPPPPTFTPGPTNTPQPTQLPPPTFTPGPSPTPLPTNTPVPPTVPPPPTNTPIPTVPTNTPVPTNTLTNRPSNTPTP